LPPAILAECEVLNVIKGEQLFAKGQRPRHLFWVHAGQVVLERAAANGSSVVLQRTLRGFVSEASLQSPVTTATPRWWWTRASPVCPCMRCCKP
jgi:hypothetical protein